MSLPEGVALPPPQPLRSFIAPAYPSVDFQCEPYVYETLQSPSHIRVLRLAPGYLESPLSCTLEQANLDDNPWFQALSYAWGDANDLFKMKCDGKEMEITRNLYEALDKLRDPDIERVLWVDAMCINQKDVLERAAQVQLMARIYSEADKVVLWLGRQYQHHIDAALAYFGVFNNPEQGEEWYRKKSMNKLQRAFTDLDGGTRRSILCLFCCPVFRRGWVIQEVALAKSVSVYWGYARFNFSVLTRCIYRDQVALAKLSHDNNMFDEFSAIRDMCMIRFQQQGGEPINPLNLMQNIRAFLFSDERDRVYGILALRISATKAVEEGLFVEPDYTVDVGSAYKKLTEKCLVKSNLLETLLFARRGHCDLGKWPTWAPRWNDLNPDWWPLRGKYSCGGERFDVKKHGILEDCLSIRGISVTKVDGIVGNFSATGSAEQAQRLLRKVWDSFDKRHTAASAMALNPYMSPLKKIATETEQELGDILVAACQQFLDRDLSKFPLSKHVPSAVNDVQGPEIANFYGRLYDEWCFKKNFFRSTEGVLGLGPIDIQEGDTVAILFSGAGPNLSFVLRQLENLWVLVGPCYIYAFMDGSAVRRWKESGEPAETFDIC